MNNKLIVNAAPHIRSSATTRKIMLDVIIALMPVIIASGFIFGYQALIVVGVTAASAVAFEYLYCYFMKKPISIGDLSAAVTGLILGVNLPASIPLWMAIIGSFVSIVIVKMLFGGLGHNFANPAVVGRIVLTLSFTAQMTAYSFPAVNNTGVDALASATPLVAGLSSDIPLLTLLIGNYGGVIGETCSIALIIGLVYLLVRKVIAPTIPFMYIGTVAVLTFLTGGEPLLQVLSGGLLLGAIFMATDYVTSPYTFKGKLIFGFGLGLLTWLIRFYGTAPEGVSFAILLMNILTPYINDFTAQKPLGGAKKK